MDNQARRQSSRYATANIESAIENLFYDQVADDEPPDATSANEGQGDKEETTSDQDKEETTSDQDENDDTGLTHEVPICVAFPNHGILTGLYNGTKIHLYPGYLTAVEKEKYALHAYAFMNHADWEEEWYSIINSANVEIVTSTNLLDASEKIKKREEERQEHEKLSQAKDKEIERLRQELVNMQMQLKELYKLMGERKDLGRITAKTPANVPPDIPKTIPKKDDRRTSAVFITDL